MNPSVWKQFDVDHNWRGSSEPGGRRDGLGIKTWTTMESDRQSDLG